MTTDPCNKMTLDMTDVRRAGRVLATAAAVGMALAACTGGGSGGGDPLKLVASRASGEDPFTTDVGYAAIDETQATSVSLPPTTATSAATAGTAAATVGTAAAAAIKVQGTAPGLYGGTRDQTACNVDQLVTFLTANPGKGKAWAAAEGISFDDLPSFIRSLTPVALLHDTRVTNHGFKGGKATPHQSVLQAGTAVLVDQNGVPRARCACGNPLVAPDATTSATKAKSKGTPWAGYDPGRVITVQPGAPTDHFVLVEPGKGTFDRPAGGNGSNDKAGPPAAADEKVYEGTGSGPLPDIDSPVPFITHRVGATVSAEGEGFTRSLGYDGAELHRAGRYANVSATAPEGKGWVVRIRPLSPLLYEQTGTGDTVLPNLPSLPPFVGVEFTGTGTAGNFYLVAKPGLVDAFTVEDAPNLVGLSVTDHKSVGWHVRLWGVPSGCTKAHGTYASVACS